MHKNLKSFLYTITAVLFWSTSATAFKITLEGMNNIQLLFYSSVASSLVLYILLSIRKNYSLTNLFKKNLLRKNFILGITNPFLYYIILFEAYSLLPAQEAMPLNYTWPITVTFFSVLFLKSRLNGKIIFGMVLAFIGVIIIGTHGNILAFQFSNLLGVILAVGSSLIWAAFWILNLKDNRTELEKLFSAFFFGNLLITLYIIISDNIILDNYNYLVGAVYIGIFEMSLTFYLWLKGLSLSNDKAKTATLVYISPFLSMLFIAQILGESILISSLLGLIFIVFGIVIQHIKIEKGKIKFSSE